MGDDDGYCGSRNLQATNECCTLALRTQRLNQRMNSVVYVLKVLSLRSFSTACFSDYNLWVFLKERLIWGLRLNVLSLFWQFEPEKVPKVFLSYLLYSISINRCGRDQDTYQRGICALLLIVLNENKKLQPRSDTK